MNNLKPSQIFWILIGATATIFSLVFFKKIIFIFLLAFILASALDFYISYFKKFKIPRSLSLILIYLIFIFGTSALVYFVSGPILTEFKSFSLNLTSLTENLAKTYPAIIKIIPKNFFANGGEWFSKIASSPESFSKIIWGVFDNITTLIFVLVLTFYLSIKRNGVEDFICFFLPKNKQEKFLNVWQRVKVKIYKWFTAQLILSFLIGLFSFIVLKILNVEYALVLSIISGIFELLPMVGPIFSGALAVLIALKQSAFISLLVVLAYILIQQTESHIIVPNIMKKAVDLNPAVIIFFVLIGAQLGGGIPGMIVAIPLGVIFKEVLNEFN